MGNVRIEGIEMYVPANKVENQYFIDSFEKNGKHIARLLEAYGRKERYMINDDDETMVTMAIKTGEKVLKSCNLTGKDIDLLIIASQTPEYLWPTNALVVFKNLGINHRAQFYDMNSNCLGMMNAVSTANLTLKGNPRMKRALVIGSEQFSIINNQTNEYLYPLFGDSACAVVLEKTEDENMGILDVDFLGDGERSLDCVLFPKNGFSDVFRNNSKLENFWEGFDAGFIPGVAYDLNKEILERNSMSFDDVDMYCYSQYAIGMLRGISELYKIDLRKFIYVGDKYGYTGTNSPFVALHDAVKSGAVKRGDTVNLWSIGTFWTTCGILMKY